MSCAECSRSPFWTCESVMRRRHWFFWREIRWASSLCTTHRAAMGLPSRQKCALFKTECVDRAETVSSHCGFPKAKFGLNPIRSGHIRWEDRELRRRCPGCGRIVKLHDAKCMSCGEELEFPRVAIASEAAIRQRAA